MDKLAMDGLKRTNGQTGKRANWQTGPWFVANAEGQRIMKAMPWDGGWANSHDDEISVCMQSWPG